MCVCVCVFVCVCMCVFVFVLVCVFGKKRPGNIRRQTLPVTAVFEGRPHVYIS